MATVWNCFVCSGPCPKGTLNLYDSHAELDIKGALKSLSASLLVKPFVLERASAFVCPNCSPHFQEVMRLHDLLQGYEPLRASLASESLHLAWKVYGSGQQPSNKGYEQRLWKAFKKPIMDNFALGKLPNPNVNMFGADEEIPSVLNGSSGALDAQGPSPVKGPSKGPGPFRSSQRLKVSELPKPSSKDKDPTATKKEEVLVPGPSKDKSKGPSASSKGPKKPKYVEVDFSASSSDDSSMFEEFKGSKKVKKGKKSPEAEGKAKAPTPSTSNPPPVTTRKSSVSKNSLITNWLKKNEEVTPSPARTPSPLTVPPSLDNVPNFDHLLPPRMSTRSLRTTANTNGSLQGPEGPPLQNTPGVTEKPSPQKKKVGRPPAPKPTLVETKTKTKNKTRPSLPPNFKVKVNVRSPMKSLRTPVKGNNKARTNALSKSADKRKTMTMSPKILSKKEVQSNYFCPGKKCIYQKTSFGSFLDLSSHFGRVHLTQVAKLSKNQNALKCMECFTYIPLSVSTFEEARHDFVAGTALAQHYLQEHKGISEEPLSAPLVPPAPALADSASPSPRKRGRPRKSPLKGDFVAPPAATNSEEEDIYNSPQKGAAVKSTNRGTPRRSCVKRRSPILLVKIGPSANKKKKVVEGVDGVKVEVFSEEEGGEIRPHPQPPESEEEEVSFLGRRVLARMFQPRRAAAASRTRPSAAATSATATSATATSATATSATNGSDSLLLTNGHVTTDQTEDEYLDTVGSNLELIPNGDALDSEIVLQVNGSEGVMAPVPAPVPFPCPKNCGEGITEGYDGLLQHLWDHRTPAWKQRALKVKVGVDLPRPLREELIKEGRDPTTFSFSPEYQAQLLIHQEQHSSASKGGNGTLQLASLPGLRRKCRKCSFTLEEGEEEDVIASETKLLVHSIQTHYTNVNCSLCGGWFASEESLEDHVRKAHED